MSNLSCAISQKYSKSLLSTIGSVSELEAIISELQLILDALSCFPGLWVYLSNQLIASKEKLYSFEKISDILKISQFAQSIINLMIQNHRLYLLGNLISQLESELDNMKHRMKFEISTAVALDNITQNRILDSLRSVLDIDIVPHFTVDPSIIGGFIAYGDSIMLDLSFKGRINQLKKEFNIT